MRSTAVALGLISFASQPVAAAIFESDNRFAADPLYDPAVKAIARAHHGFRKATAFLVGRCHAATAQHLVSMKRDPVGRHVWLHLFGNRAKVRSTVIDAGHMERRENLGDYRRDWILLRLDRCLPEGTAVFRVTSRLQEGLVATAGYPEDLSAPAVERDCRIRSFSFRGFLHDCASYPGSSGSPIYIRGSGAPIVVAIQSAGFKSRRPEPFEFNRANVAAPAWDLADALKRDRVGD